jgi:exosome complex RNA-binding protein Rrp42 (RNase PH superfamily)
LNISIIGCSTVMLFFTSNVFSAEKSAIGASMKTEAYMDRQLAVEVDENHHVVYASKNAMGEFHSVDLASFNELVAEYTAEAKKIGCKESIRPDSVSLALGVLSLEWKTSNLCK